MPHGRDKMMKAKEGEAMGDGKEEEGTGRRRRGGGIKDKEPEEKNWIQRPPYDGF